MPSRRGTRSARAPAPSPAARGGRDALDTYSRKRDFGRTSEPGVEIPEPADGPLTFVMQRHAARRLHYDLRLELDGVMLSWAIPRGPSAEPGERRLAARVEDHPLDYARFEGVIPPGEYGAGEVIVWDRGTYSPDEGGALSFHDRTEAEERMRAALAEGKLSVRMRGHRMKGSWALVRTGGSPGGGAARTDGGGGEEGWLLLKHRDEASGGELTSELDSVISDLSVDRLKAGHRAPRGLRPPPLRPAELEGAQPLPARRRDERAPMLATATERPFSRAGWVFEPKLDGVRALARIAQSGEGAPTVTLTSRRGVDVSRAYPLLARELAEQPLAGALIDGEIVAIDQAGRPSFELLQRRINLQNEVDIQRAASETPVRLYIFDLVELEGYDLTRVPLAERLRTLSLVISPTSRIRLVERVQEDGVAAYRAAVALGFEGVVAKRADSPYEPGRRSASWVKVKSRSSDEFVVCGYIAGKGARAATLGALVVAEYRRSGPGSEPALTYVGRVGSGFSDARLAELRERLDALSIAESPLAEIPAEGRAAIWVRPELVCEVTFSERTSSGRLRAPVFLRMRPDRDPDDSVRHPAGAPDSAVARAAGRRREITDRGSSLGEQAAEAAAQLEGAARTSLRLVVGGVDIRLTNLDKPLWPPHAGQDAVTKRGLLLYLARAAPPLLRHLRDRPLTLTRYPNGLEGGSFYQKHWDEGRPEWVQTVQLPSQTAGERVHVLCNNLPTLMWLGQLAVLELHASLARSSGEPEATMPIGETGRSLAQAPDSLLDRPDYLLFDLDPYIYSGREQEGSEPELNRRGWAASVELALRLRELLETAGLPSFVKTSGATGLHVHVPIVREPAFGYAGVRSICQTFAEFLESAHPGEVTLRWRTGERRGRVFLDVNQNARSKNMAAPYSPRARPGAPVSTPLLWEELERVYPSDFTVATLPERLATVGDPWAGILEAKRRLSKLGLDGADGDTAGPGG